MNDLILNLLANDSFTVSDFKAAGLTADNTKLESEDRYKSSQMIQENELFKDENGNFSEDIFHQYYLYATQVYNRMADETYIEDITKNTFYSKDNIFAPGESPKIDETPIFVTSPNPFLQNNSLTRVGKKGDRTLSISEIAQSQKIYDSDKKEFRDESVNDRAFSNNPFKWLGDLFSEPLVVAQWDEDGEHVDPLTGEIKKHKKGDYKYNDEGTFYYETLNGRDVYGKQVLNRMNTLTVDGSKANKYDFFDSDDLEQKSFIGSVMKNLALVGSMFLPVVGKPIIAASIATQAVGLLGALDKMFLGSESETANNLHAWAKTVNRQSVSEYASQNTWCWENMLNMIGDTVGQLAEQRFLFTHVPALFKGTKGINARDTKTYNELVEKGAKEIQEKTNKDFIKSIQNIKAGSQEAMEKELTELTHQWKTMSMLKSQAALEKYMQSYNKLGSIMSKAYMTGITVQDTYGEAKANGASDMEALALTLGYAAGEAWILNTGLGEWIMPELHGDKLKYRAIINALKKEVKPLSEDITETATKEGRQNLFKKIFNIGKRIATDDYARQHYISQTYNPMAVVLAHAAGEGFEEVSEELLADVSKSAFNTINWLRGDETRISGAWENIGDRYGMSLLGGFIGGGISSVNTDFSYAQQLAKMTNESAMQEIVYMINNDKIDDFLKFANKATLGSKHLSFDTDENGNFKAGTKENNQDKEIKKMLNNQVQLIKDVINAEGAKFSENSLFDALTLKDLRYLQLRDTATVGAYFQEYNSLVSQMVQKQKEIRDLTGESTNTDTKKKELTQEQSGEVAKKRQELNDLRVRKDAILSGKRAPEFIATALYEAQQALHGHNRGYTWQEWVEAHTQKKYEQLTDSELKELKPKYKAYRETEMKNDVIGDARQFVHMVGLASNAIQQQQERIKQIQEEGIQDASYVQTYLGNLLNGLNSMATDEEFDVDEFITRAQADFNRIIPGTALDLSQSMFDAETIAKLQYIENTPEIPGYTKKQKDEDRLITIFEAFADYTDTITQKFIDQGYIHPEVKNHLINTYNTALKVLEDRRIKEVEDVNGNQGSEIESFSAYRNAEDLDDLETIMGNRSPKLIEFVKNLQTKVDLIKQLNHTPIIDLLENFKVATSETNSSVKDIIQTVNNLLNQSYEDISSFGLDDSIMDQLDEIDNLIDVVASALYATRVDEAGINNAWGYSKTLNELNKKYGNKEWVELAEIEGQTADLMQQDLALLKQKVHFAKNLHKINRGQKLNRQNKVGYNKQFIFFNKLKRVFQLLPEKLPDWKLDSILSVINDENLLSNKYNGKTRAERKFSFTPEEKIQFEEEQIKIGDAIYQFFQDNSSRLNNPDQLSEFLDPSIFQLYDPAVGLLDDEVADLDDNQFIFELAAKAAVQSSDFYNVLRKTFGTDKAPVPMQEQATYLNVAMVLNGDVVNNFAKAYAKSIIKHFQNSDETTKRKNLTKLGYDGGTIDNYVKNPEQFALDQAAEKYVNIVLTEGIAGSGKSGGVFDSTVKILRHINPELVDNAYVVNATLENANTLKEQLGIKGKTFSSSHDEQEHDLLKYFYTDFTLDYKDKVKFKDNQLLTNFTLREDLSDTPKIIFIDEASRYDYVQMKLLQEAAQHYGVAILAAGDFDQISAKNVLSEKIDDNNSREITLSPSRLNFIRSPKLGVSFRTLNSQMSKNQTEVLATLNNSDKNTFTFYNWEDAENLHGFKVHKDSEIDKIKEAIGKMKKQLKEGEKIGYLYANKDASSYNKIKELYGDLIDGKAVEDAQGLEGKYYIVDLNHSTNSDIDSLKKYIYTGFTRSKMGGVIIYNNNPVDKFQINSIQEESSQLESITPEAITKAIQKRKEVLDTIFEGKEDTTIEYRPLTKVKKESTVTEKSDETVEEEGLAPSVPTTETTEPPQGMYLNREDAEKVDLSAYKEGFELYDKDDTLVGTVEKVDIIEQTAEDRVYYVPVVVVKEPSNTTKALFAESLSNYTLKDPTKNLPVPKYNIGNIFYDADGNSVEVIEITQQDPIEYKVQSSTGVVKTILESELDTYSVNPPIKPSTKSEEDLGENDTEELYKSKLERANDSKLKQTIESDGRIHHWLYTFNSYETGVLWDDKGFMREEHFVPGPVYNRTQSRVDNANGLLRMGKIGSDTHKDEVLNLLTQIHSVLMHDKDNSSVIKSISRILNLQEGQLSSIQYGIKSSSGVSKGASGYGTRDTDEDKEWWVYDKHADESLEYTQPDVIAGDHISRKTVVALFRDSEGNKVLEITLGVLNSPLTIGQTVNSNGEYIYGRVGKLIERLTPDSPSSEVFKVCSEAVQICKEDGYTDLHNLFKAFLYTSNGFAPLANAGDFNLASQKNFGPNVISKKGDYQKDSTRRYETKYIDLNEFVKDQRVVVSDIWIPKSNEYAGTVYPIHRGYPGVFVSYNKSYNKADLASIYMKQISQGYNGVKDVDFYYVVPPEATMGEYFRNFRNAYLNHMEKVPTRPVYSIGNMWTAYKLLKNIYQAGVFDATHLESQLQDYVPHDDIKTILDKLIAIEQRTDWKGDSTYDDLVEQHKKWYANKATAEKYATRSIILQQQQAILEENFGTTGVPTHKVLLYFLTNAVYRDKSEVNPRQNVLDFIAKYNQGTVKYKVHYDGDSTQVGMFVKAKTDKHNNYALPAVNEDGSHGYKSFQINSKIDPPIFEIDALTNAIGILAQWEYKDPGNTNSRKVPGRDLENSNRGYIRDGKPTPKMKTALQLLKDNNKALFTKSGLFRDITIDNPENTAFTQLQYAEEILTKFNSEPNNLGFAIVDSSGKIKMYAMKIDQLSEPISKNEIENSGGLGNITINMPLIFTSKDDVLQFSTANRNYKVSIDGKQIVFEHTKLTSNTPKLTKISYQKSNTLDQNMVDVYNASIKNAQIAPPIKNTLSKTIDELQLLDEYDKDDLKMLLESLNLHEIDGIKQVYDYLSNNTTSTLDLSIGTLVSTNDTDFTQAKHVKDIQGNMVYLEDDSVIDITKQELYKKEDELIECPKFINIPYGK